MTTITLHSGSELGAIRKAGARDVPRIGQVLARAFFDDPVFRWALPDDDRRAEALPAVFALFAAMLQGHDETYVAGDAAGAALWVPPGRQAIAEDDAEEFGRRMERILRDDAARMFEIAELLDEHHPHGSFHYLHFLGVEPRWQGRGAGSALLVDMLHRSDHQGVPAYLDATSPRNKRLYERHGFEAVGELAPASGPPLWPMWRRPAAR